MTLLRRKAWRFVHRFVLLIFPSLPFVWWVNSHKVSDYPDDMTFEQHREHWEDQLRNADQSHSDAIALAYQVAIGRITGLESKAVGLFGAASIVSAGAFVACTGPTPSAVAGLIALSYIISALGACGWVALPRPRQPLVLRDVMSATAGSAEMAAATRMLEPPSTRTANFVTSAVYDLIRGSTVTVIALLIFVI